MLRRITSGVESLSRWVGKIARWGVYFIVIAMTYEVAARYIFNRPTIWAAEFSQQMFGAYFMLAGCVALLEGAHVNMDIFYNKLSIRGRAAMDLITSPLFFLFAGMLFYQGALQWWDSAIGLEVSESTWAIPRYPLKFMIPLGAGLILLQGLANLSRSIFILAKGRVASWN